MKSHRHNSEQFGSRAGRGWMRQAFVGYLNCQTCEGRGWVMVDDGDGGTKTEQCEDCQKRKESDE